MPLLLGNCLPWATLFLLKLARFDGHVGPLLHFLFSENGYFLATAAHDVVKLWDLRKLKNLAHFLPMIQISRQTVEFDQSRIYLAIAGSNLRIYQVANVKSGIKTIQDVSGTETKYEMETYSVSMVPSDIPEHHAFQECKLS